MLIENNPDDAENILSIIESINNKYKRLYMKTHEEALQFLKEEDSLPQLILLGSTQDDYSNIDFLKNIKTDSNLKKIPIVMISSSSNHNYVAESFNYGAAGYMLKTKENSELSNTINTIIKYWNTCELPHSLE